MTTLASPYAAPNTPIASSKRPRPSSTKKLDVRTVDLTSPVKILRYHGNSESSHVETPPPPVSRAGSYSLGIHSRSNDHSPSDKENAPETILFSPCLRMQEDDGVDDDEGSFDDEAVDESLRQLHSPVHHSVGLPAPPTSPGPEEEEDEDTFNPYLFIASLPHHDTVARRDGFRWLPPKAIAHHNKATLVLDLDETLVHCTVEPIERPDMVFPVNFNGTGYQVYVRKRPFLDQFLRSVAQKFEVVLFTASQKVYADILLDRLDPEGSLFHHRLFRESCVQVHGNYIKDLTVLGRDLATTVLVDNSPHAYGFQVDNGIPIESWFDDETDTELLKLENFLHHIEQETDVREVVRGHYKTHELLDHARRRHHHHHHRGHKQ